MDIRIKKVLAMAGLPIAAAGLVAGFMGAGAANAASPNVNNGTPVTQTATPSASTKTLPWCGWTIQGLPTSLTLLDKAVTGTAVSKYKGVAIDLEGSANDIKAFVGGSDSYNPDVDNCSWFNDSNKQGLSLTVSAASAKFTASAATGGADPKMDFSLSDSNKLNIVPSYGTDCANGFSTDSALSVYGTNLTTTPVHTTNKSDVTTVSACTWSLKYSTQIPGGLSPAYGDQTYTFTGPTLTTTVTVN